LIRYDDDGNGYGCGYPVNFQQILTTGFGFDAKLLSWVIFVVLYTVIMAVRAIIVAWPYNFVASKLNSSVVISLEPKE
jgi:hypothetical protein